MSTSTFPAAKAHLVALLQASAGLNGVTVDYGDPGGALQREHVFLGGTGSDGQDWGPMGNRARDEDYTIEFLVHVKIPGGTQQEATERAHVLFGVIETTMRPLPDATLAANGVRTIEIKPRDVVEFISDSHACLIGGEIAVNARI